MMFSIIASHLYMPLIFLSLSILLRRDDAFHCLMMPLYFDAETLLMLAAVAMKHAILSMMPRRLSPCRHVEIAVLITRRFISMPHFATRCSLTTVHACLIRHDAFTPLFFAVDAATMSSPFACSPCRHAIFATFIFVDFRRYAAHAPPYAVAADFRHYFHFFF